MANFDFLSKIRSTIEGLFGQDETKATLSPVHITRPPKDKMLSPVPEGYTGGVNGGGPLPQDPKIDQSRQAAVDGLVAQGVSDPKALLTLLNGQGGKNKGDFTFQEITQRLQGSQIPTPQPTAAPGIDNAMEFIKSQMPQSSTQTPEQYYPALQDPQFMQGIQDADQKRQGMSGLALLQAFFESTLGRASNGNNIFGALPPGGKTFNSPAESLDYQMSPAVLGGGANPNMNILKENTPLTEEAITKLYDSYNPNSPYLQTLLSALFPNGPQGE